MLKPVTGFVDDSGVFYSTENAAHRARLRKEIHNLLSRQFTFMQSGQSGQAGTVVEVRISVDTVISERANLIELLAQYERVAQD